MQSIDTAAQKVAREPGFLNQEGIYTTQKGRDYCHNKFLHIAERGKVP